MSMAGSPKAGFSGASSESGTSYASATLYSSRTSSTSGPDGQLVDRWYEALYEEDSLRLIALLKEHPDLWKIGWESELSRRVTGRPRNYWKKRTETRWMGRTALHVGARRGCVPLLEQILGLCLSPGQISPIKWLVQGAYMESEPMYADDDSSARTLEALLLAVDGEYKLDAIAIAVVNGNQNVVSLLLKVGMNCAAVADRYAIRLESNPKAEDLEKWEKEDNHRNELKMITKQVIERFKGDADFRKVVLSRYENHRDFNFLPREEYLFHFLFDQFIDDEVILWSQDPLFRLRANDIYQIVVAVIANMVSRSSCDLWSFLWSLQDGQGRTPLHVAADDNSPLFLDGGSWKPLALVMYVNPPVDETALKRAIDARDGSGRTAWHRSVAQGNSVFLISYLTRHNTHRTDFLSDSNPWNVGNVLWDARREYLSSTNWNDFEQRETGWRKIFRDSMTKRESSVVTRMLWKCRTGFCYRMSLDVVSGFDGFEGSRLIDPTYEDRRAEGPRDNVAHGDSLTTLTPLHSVIIHKHSELCTSFFKWPVKGEFLSSSDTSKPLMLYKRLSAAPTDRKFSASFDVNFLELAALVGNPKMLMTLLQQTSYKDASRAAVCQAFQFVAASGKYDLLQIFTGEGYDPLQEDVNGNALHYATKGMNILEGEILFAPHWIDYVTCEQILGSREQRKNDTKDRSDREHIATQKEFVEKVGCINLLIQLGCDIFKASSTGQVPYPAKDASPNFLSWWHEKHAKEFAQAQNALSLATTAISVTAALVATASYVGPLQPPLSYESDPTQLRLHITAVQVFIICDTMSFYLAIAAIIFALIPCLPIPQQPMTIELRRTKRMVNVAVALLFPSIIFVLVAFAAGSIAVIQTNQTEWNRGGLTIGTASVGGFICLVAAIMFSIRVLAIIFHESRTIKKLYNATSF